MKKSIAITAVAGLAAAASAQSVTHQLTLTNQNSGDSATNGSVAAAAGDTITAELSFDTSIDFEDGGNGGILGWAGNIAFNGGGLSNFNNGANEDHGQPGDLGRNGNLSTVISDTPVGSPVPGNDDFDFLSGGDGNDWYMTDQGVGGDGEDGDGVVDFFTQSPPAFAGDSALIDNGDTVYAFTFEYGGEGVATLGTSQRDSGGFAVWNGTSVGDGQTSIDDDVTLASATVTPAPASLALLGLGGLTAARRRRA